MGTVSRPVTGLPRSETSSSRERCRRMEAGAVFCTVRGSNLGRMAGVLQCCGSGGCSGVTKVLGGAAARAAGVRPRRRPLLLVPVVLLEVEAKTSAGAVGSGDSAF